MDSFDTFRCVVVFDFNAFCYYCVFELIAHFFVSLSRNCVWVTVAVSGDIADEMMGETQWNLMNDIIGLTISLVMVFIYIIICKHLAFLFLKEIGTFRVQSLNFIYNIRVFCIYLPLNVGISKEQRKCCVLFVNNITILLGIQFF